MNPYNFLNSYTRIHTHTKKNMNNVKSTIYIVDKDLSPTSTELKGNSVGAGYEYVHCKFNSGSSSIYTFPVNAPKIYFRECFFSKNCHYKFQIGHGIIVCFINFVPPLAKIDCGLEGGEGKIIFLDVGIEMDLLGFRGFRSGVTVSFQGISGRKLDYRFFLNQPKNFEITNCQNLEDVDEISIYRDMYPNHKLGVQFIGNNTGLTKTQIMKATQRPVYAHHTIDDTVIDKSSLENWTSKRMYSITGCTFLEGETCYRMLDDIWTLEFVNCTFSVDGIIAFGKNVYSIEFYGKAPPMRNLNIQETDNVCTIIFQRVDEIDCAGFLGFNTKIQLHFFECYFEVFDIRFLTGHRVIELEITRCWDLYDIDELSSYAAKSPNLVLHIENCDSIPANIIRRINSVSANKKIHNQAASEVLPLLTGIRMPRLNQSAPLRKLPIDLIRMVYSFQTGEGYNPL